jgi:hypothetical protein
VTLTFLASPAQAELLAELEANGVMQFALVYRGDKAVADEFLARQDEYLVKALASKAGPSDSAGSGNDEPEGENSESGGGTETGVGEDARGE